MKSKPTYEELKNRVSELKSEAASWRFAEESLKKGNEVVNSILSAKCIATNVRQTHDCSRNLNARII